MEAVFRSFVTLIRLATSLLPALLIVGGAAAQSGGMGPLGSVLPTTGQDGPWRYQSAETGFTMTNGEDAGALQYFYLNPNPGTEGRRQIDVDVAIDPSRDGLAGLLYGFDPETRFYFVFALEPGNTVSFYRRDQSGFNPMLQSQIDAVRPGANRLTIIEKGRDVALMINGVRVGEIGTAGTGQGGVGIAAAGLVRATFGGFAVSSPRAGNMTQPPKATGDASTSTAGAAGSSAAGTRAAHDPATESGLAGPLHLKPIEIVDTTGPFGPIPAYSTVVPTNWQVEGGVVWNPQNGCFRGARLVWGTGTPDQRYGIAFLPPISWTATNYGRASRGCLAMDLPDAEAAMRGYLQNMPGVEAEVIAVERPPELVQMVRQNSRGSAQPSLPGLREWQDVAVLRAKVRAQGQDSETAFIIMTHHYEGVTPDGFGQGGKLVMRGGVAGLVLAISTPAGELENGHPAFGPVLSNLRENPVWKQNHARWWAQQNRPATPSGGAIASGGSQSIGDMMFDSWKRREGMKDAGHASSIGSIWETQRYRTPGGQVTLSQNYRNAWQLNDGSFVLTDDDLFNPTQTFDQFGQQLAPLR